MGIPVDEADWASLEPRAKRERLLSAAAEVFARDGLDASMPTIAAAAGAGVASVYRQFPSKQDLLAELVVGRLDQIAAGAERAAAEPGERWSALTRLLRRLVEQQASDQFLGEARTGPCGRSPAVPRFQSSLVASSTIGSRSRSRSRGTRHLGSAHEHGQARERLPSDIEAVAQAAASGSRFATMASAALTLEGARAWSASATGWMPRADRSISAVRRAVGRTSSSSFRWSST